MKWFDLSTFESLTAKYKVNLNFEINHQQGVISYVYSQYNTAQSEIQVAVVI